MGHQLSESARGSNLKVVSARVYSAWIGHGSYSAIGSFFTGLFTGNSITHWWVEIQTSDPNIWYCAQFDKPDLTLTRHSSSDGVKQAGIAAAGREEGDHVSITCKYSFNVNDNMGDVYRWMLNQDGDYNLVTNNCQDFGKNFYKRFEYISPEERERMEQRRKAEEDNKRYNRMFGIGNGSRSILGI